MLITAFAGYITGLSLIVAIGTQNTFVLRQGLRREHVLPVVIVCAAADALLIGAGVAGLGAAISAYPAALDVVRYGGASFLLVYSVLAARRALRPRGMSTATRGTVTLRSAMLTCLALTFLNPHVYLDTIVMLGSLANQYGEQRWSYGAGAITASLSWFVVLGFGASKLGRFFAQPRSWRLLDAAIAVVMLVLGVVMLIDRPGPLP